MTMISWKSILLLGVMMACGSSFTTVSISHSTDRTLALRMSDQQVNEASETDPTEASSPPPPPVKCPDCDLCDGSGRIEGGLGAILGWWPIRAYRPCPNFVERGGFYQRSGQGLDEIAFGRDSTFDAGGK